VFVQRPKLVPELYCSDFIRSLKFYTEILGFSVRYARPEQRFAYLEREGAELMIEQTVDLSRLFLAGPLEQPLGRGMHFQIEVSDVEALYRKVTASSAKILLTIEDRWYRRDNEEVGNRQFVTIDPDGYVLRFAQSLGVRSRREK
jgi:catechol 2,3-dioxygenase-like lactoylglutathione lyase family enzyme